MPSLAALDSSAILAVFFREPGSEVVAPLLGGALLSTVNLVEVHTRMIDRGAPSKQAWRWIQTLQCETCVFTDEQARIEADRGAGVDIPAAADGMRDQGLEQGGRNVVDAVEVDVLQQVQRHALARSRQAADDDQTHGVGRKAAPALYEAERALITSSA